MPTYDYRCVDCRKKLELILTSTADRAEHYTCKACGGTLERQPSAPAFALRGTGFHANDYPKRRR